MTTISAAPYRKRKQNVYGRTAASRYNTSSLQTFFDDDEGKRSLSNAASARPGEIREAGDEDNTEMRKHTLARVRSRAGQRDNFDVPSSGSEIESPPRLVTKPIVRERKALVDDRSGAATSLTPWEKRIMKEATREKDHYSTNNNSAPGSPEAQLRGELNHAMGTGERMSTSESTAKRKRLGSQGVATATSPSKSMAGKSVMARLAARRSAQRSAQRSADELLDSTAGNEVSSFSSRAASPARSNKRVKTISREASHGVHLADPISTPRFQGVMSSPSAATAEPDMYDVFEPVEDKPNSPRAKSRKHTLKDRAQRPTSPKQMVKAVNTLSQRDLSASNRLMEIMVNDTDFTEATTPSSKTSTSRRATPQRPSTPSSNEHIGQDNSIRANGTITPKQAQLWSRLLPVEASVPSPSALAMRGLTLSGRQGIDSSSVATPNFEKTRPAAARRRTRLVDRLKASRPPSSDEDSDIDRHQESAEPSMNRDFSAPTEEITEGINVPDGASQVCQTQSQSQSQSHVSLAAAAPKRTYAAQRSYLPEDSLEDDLMLGLNEETPQFSKTTKQPRFVSASASASQKDAFDLDDSDEEGNTVGKIRTIHELRASGRNFRGTQDIEGLLEDIENHSASHRSRRRNALVDLAIKLCDKAFFDRIVTQNAELRLLGECGAYADNVADFVLSSILAQLLAGELSEHGLRAMTDRRIVKWLATQLAEDVEICAIARNRQTNLSKVAQTALVTLVNLLSKHSTLWEDVQPENVTPRLMALKALDLLIGRARRAGDQSEILDTDDLDLLLRPREATTMDQQVDISLGISILECLSASPTPRTWPSSIFTAVAIVLPTVSATNAASRHILFLALRLSVHLTSSDSKRSCRLLSTNATIPHLFQTIHSGLHSLSQPSALSIIATSSERNLTLDLILLAISVLATLIDHSPSACDSATSSPLLPSLVRLFRQAQTRTVDAESVEESVSNVAYGYLAVLLATLCTRSSDARNVVKAGLPGNELAMLVQALEEFVVFNDRVDSMGLESVGEIEEGRESWGIFTAKLRGVLRELEAVQEAD